MKTNLDSAFKTDTSLEIEGVWFEIQDGVKFKCRRFGGMNSQKVKAISAKYLKPFLKQIELGTLSEQKSREITVKSFVESCLVDWSGVVVDGVEAPFTVESAIKLLVELPALAETLIKYSGEMNPYKEDLGNS
jgi:hypothetical protein